MTTSPMELRDLAAEIERVGRASPCWSVAHPWIRTLTDHLCAVARVHETRAWTPPIIAEEAKIVEERAAIDPEMWSRLRRQEDCPECGGGPCRRRPRHGDGMQL